MTLDQFVQPPLIESEKTDHDSSLAELFGRSALYELHQSAFGLAQTVGLQNCVGAIAPPKEADSFWGEQAQMLGRGAGNFLPTMVVAIAARGAVGSALEHAGAAADNLLLKRTAIGLSLTESAVTGLVSGALLKPSDEQVARDWSSFIADRAMGGVAGGLSYSAMTLSTFGWNKIAGSKAVAAVGLDGLFKSAALTGVVSGVPGGLANVEISSLLSDGKFTTDSGKIGQSIYEMSVFGGVFGAASSLLAPMSANRFSAQAAESETSSFALAEYVNTPHLEAFDGSKYIYAAGQPKLASLKEAIKADPEQQASKARLQELFGAESSLVDKLESVIGDGSVIDFKKMDMFISEAPERRGPLVIELLEQNVSASTLRPVRLLTLEKLNKHFGEGSPVVQTLLDADQEGGRVPWQGIREFIVGEGDSGQELLRKLVERGDLGLERDRLFGLARLNEIYGENSDSTRALRQLTSGADSKTINLSEVAKFINEQPAERKAFIEHLVEGGAKANEFNPYRLRGLESLQKIYSDSPEVLRQIVAVEEQGDRYLLWRLSNFIDSSQESGKELVAELAPKHDAHLLNPDGLFARLMLNDIYGKDSEIVKHLAGEYEKDRTKFSFQGLAEFIKGAPESRQQLVKRLAEEAGDAKYLGREWLRAAEMIEEAFGSGSPEAKLALTANGPTAAVSIADAHDHSPEGTVALLHRFAESGATVLPLHKWNVDTYIRLNNQLKFDPDLAKRVFAGVQPDFEPTALVEFLAKSPDNPEFLKSMMEMGLALDKVSELPAWQRVSDYLGAEPELIRRAIAFDQQGLKLSWLDETLRNDPVKNILLVRALLQEPSLKGDVSTISDISQFQHYLSTLKIPKYFGADDDLITLAGAAGRNWDQPSALVALARFMDDEPGTHPEIVHRLLLKATPPPEISQEWLSGVERLYKQFGADHATFERILWLNAAKPGELAGFVDAEGRSGKELVRKIAVGTFSQPLDLEVSRLHSLARLNRTFGEDSPPMQRLLRLESENVSLKEVASFIQDDPQRKALVESLIEAGAERGAFRSFQLEGRLQLNAVFGADSVMIRQLSTRPDAKDIDFLELNRFIQGDYAEQSSEPAAKILARAALVEKAVQTGASPERLGGVRLQALFDLNELLGEDSDAMKRILEKDKTDDLVLIDLAALANSDLGRAYIEKFAHDKERRLDGMEISALVELNDLIRPDQATAARIVELVHDGLDAEALAVFIMALPGREKTVARLIRDGVSAAQLSSQRLEALDQLGKVLSDKLNIFSDLVKLEPAGLNLAELSSFLDVPQRELQRINLVSEVLANGGGAEKLAASRLAGLEWAQEVLGKNSPVLELILARESEGVSLSDLHQLAYGLSSSKTAMDYITRLLAENQPPERFQLSDMLKHAALGKVFAEGSPLFERLVALCDEGLDPVAFANSVAWHEDHLPAIESIVKAGATVKDLTSPRFENLVRIYAELSAEPLMIKRLLDMEGQGLDLIDIEVFLTERPGNGLVLGALLKKGYGPRELSLANLGDRQGFMEIAKHLKPTSLDYLEELRRNGLSGLRVAQYIAERPEQRSSIVERLVEDKVDASRFKDQMRLIAFPENVAYALAERARSDGLSVPAIVGYLRDWQSGRYFRELVIDQVQSGKPIAAEDLRALASRARQLGSSVSQEVESSATGYRKASEPLTKLADTLKHAAERIESVVSKDKPLVLLGRDTWPLLPLMRARGYDASYFLWSRANGHDPKTYDQWMKEVPPGAVVIDTGFGGRIINWIRDQDKTVSGLLLSKNTGAVYEQILQNPDHRERAEALEELIKYTRRSKSYTERGGVKFEKEGSDGNVARKYSQFDGTNRIEAEGEIRDLLRASGLPEWDVWRYSTYVGLTPQERLGLSSRAQVEEHYRNIEQLRKEHSGDESATR